MTVLFPGHGRVYLPSNWNAYLAALLTGSAALHSKAAAVSEAELGEQTPKVHLKTPLFEADSSLRTLAD